MAKGRFVSKEIATDRELNVLCSFEADYLFQRCIPHLDVEGRMEGFADVVKATAVPLRGELSVDMVRACLAELQEHDLICWYDVENRRYLEFPGFEVHQKGLRKDREADSKCPPCKSSNAIAVEYSGPTPEELRMRSAQEKLSEVKGSEEKKAGGSLPGGRSPPEAAPRAEDPPEDEPWNDRIAAALRDYAYPDGEPSGSWTVRQDLSIARQLIDKGYSVEHLEEAIEAVRVMAEREHPAVRGFIGPEDQFTLRVLNRKDETGQKLVQVAPSYLLKLEEIGEREPPNRVAGGML